MHQKNKLSAMIIEELAEEDHRTNKGGGPIMDEIPP
jgi:hypothetical protein